MPTYTVHLPKAALNGDKAAMQEMELVKDAFSIPALIFSVFWLLWHRLWLASVIVMCVYVIFISGVYALHIHPAFVMLMESAIGFFLALEGSSLRRWTLKRKGMPTVDVVIADNLEDAEVKAIARWCERTPETGLPISPTPKTSFIAPHAPEVIALFPMPEGRS
jgi:hypothetical protein